MEREKKAVLEKGNATELAAGIVPSHGISLDLPNFDGTPTRPANITHLSSPAYESPLRHHRRKPSTPHQVKETLHAHSEYTNSEDDGAAIHRINQYIIKQEIGRGSFGAVHLAVDQHGNEFAVKEFSKSRLRKRAQSSILRRPHGTLRPGHLAAGVGFNSPLHRHSASDLHDQEEGGDPLYLIRQEVAIMKKLNHNNLVSLIEVLDDPNEDSLYMVLEMCKKGVVMKVGMNERADPYDSESCRCWFRDLILGIEYLHAQGVVHRDIKPDNLLLTEDDVLKIVDFGVSELFEKQSDMMTTKSAGSPAFLPPELCVSKHGDLSGKAVDIWSMGVTLYCLHYGKVPFEKLGVLELYDSIKNDELRLDPSCEADFKDLMLKILEKDPSKRIQMPELRDHPWVTKRGADPLLSAEENTADLVEPPTEEEMKGAITGNLSNLLIVMKAAKKFKNLLRRRRPYLMDDVLGLGARRVQPPMSIDRPDGLILSHKAQSLDTDDRQPIEQALAREGVHHVIDPHTLGKPPRSGAILPDLQAEQIKIQVNSDQAKIQKLHQPFPRRSLNAHPEAHRAHALDHEESAEPVKKQSGDALDEFLFLQIGPSEGSWPLDVPAVSESPPAAEGNIYETAYHDEVERIRSQKGMEARMYLTRRVDNRAEYKNDDNMIGVDEDEPGGKKGLANVLYKAMEKRETANEKERKDVAESKGAMSGLWPVHSDNTVGSKS